MKLRPGKNIAQFIELSFRLGNWQLQGIPEQGCRIRQATLDALLAHGGGYDADLLIHGLMDWLDVTDDPEPALSTLRALLDRHYPPDGQTHGKCTFVDEDVVKRSFRLGSIDIHSDVIAWQRGSWPIAFAQRSSIEPGRLLVGAPSPLSLSVARTIHALGLESFMEAPYDSYRAAMGMSASTANFYAWEHDEVTTCHWPHGFGKREHLGEIIASNDELNPVPADNWLALNQLAVMIDIAIG